MIRKCHFETRVENCHWCWLSKFSGQKWGVQTGRWEEEDDTTRGLAEGQFPELYSLMTKAMSSTIKMEDLFWGDISNIITGHLFLLLDNIFTPLPPSSAVWSSIVISYHELLTINIVRRRTEVCIKCYLNSSREKRELLLSGQPSRPAPASQFNFIS